MTGVGYSSQAPPPVQPRLKRSPAPGERRYNSHTGTFAFVPLKGDLVPRASVVLPAGGQDEGS